MLTLLTVDGFKNLLKFNVDFGPFNCIAGPNGVGKSNIFDAIGFLSLLASNPIREAALNVRGDPSTTDERDLFWQDGNTQADSFRIAAEMIVPPKVFDDFGRAVAAESTYLRYEMEIGYQEHENGLYSHSGRLFLLSETLHNYTKEEAKERLRFPYSEEFFEASIINKTGVKRHFIETKEGSEAQHDIIVHLNGSHTTQVVPATKTPQTIIAGIGLSTSPTILAAQREMQSWKILAMEPSAIRLPDPINAEPHLAINGAHVHATLRRMASTAALPDTEPEDVYLRVANRLSELVPTWNLSVDLDPIRQLLTIKVLESRFRKYKVPARSLSDGALRFLTLAVLYEDPEFQSLVCIEEPENGIHPSKLERIVELLKEIAIDPMFVPDWVEGNPMRQVIIATHSPYLVQFLQEEDLLLAIGRLTKGASGHSMETLDTWPLYDTWRVTKNGHAVTLGSFLAYLKNPLNANIQWKGIGS
jgi:predicted ATPase